MDYLCVTEWNWEIGKFLDMGKLPFGNRRQELAMAYMEKFFEDKNKRVDILEKAMKGKV